jgi:regulatory protein
LRGTELARAREVWRRKFGVPPQEAAERARQMRFLAGRGFSGDVVRRVVSGADDGID